MRVNRALRHGRRVRGARCDLRVRFHCGAHAETDPAVAERPGRRFVWHRAPPGVPAWIRADGREARIAERDGSRADYDTEVRRILPYCAALQGRVMLHAAAAAVPDGIHAFIGPSGAGKSTLAHQLVAAGIAVVADDLLLCVERQGRLVIPLPRPRRAGVAPLTAVYFLERGAGLAEPRCRPLSKREGFAQLLRHGFGELALAEVWALQFRVCRRIAEQARAYRLEMPDDLGRLRESAAVLIRDHLGDLPG